MPIGANQRDLSDMTDCSKSSALPVRDAAAQAQLEAMFRDLFEHKITFNEFLGFRVECLSMDELRIGFDMRPELVGHFVFGRLHGGVISSVLDATGGLAVMWAIADFHSSESAEEIMQRFAYIGTIDLRIDYLRQGTGERFTASSHVVRLGRRIATTQMQLLDDQDILIATGTANYIVC
jgi:uncharacterized protein (TIGR00369 family)